GGQAGAPRRDDQPGTRGDGVSSQNGALLSAEHVAKAPTRRRRLEAVRALPVRPSKSRLDAITRGPSRGTPQTARPRSPPTTWLRRRLGGAARRPCGLCPCGRLNPVWTRSRGVLGGELPKRLSPPLRRTRGEVLPDQARHPRPARGRARAGGRGCL